MFSYKQDGKLQGLIVHHDGIYDYSLAAYSVDETEFNKQLKKRRIIGSAIILGIIGIPSILIPMSGTMMGMGIFIACFSGFTLFLGGLGALVQLFQKNELLFKYSNGYNSRNYFLENTDQNYIFQRTYSKIFADNGNTVFWFKIFNTKNESLLREATEIMLSEKKMRDFLITLDHHRNYIARSETAVNGLEQFTDDGLLVLEEKFKEFRDEVMEIEIEYDLGIDEIMEMAVNVRS